MSAEVWKAVPGFEGLYEVSDHGRVRSLDRYEHIANRWGSTTLRLKKGRILRAYVNRDRGGYRYVNLHAQGNQHMRRVPVLVARAFLGKPPGGHEVRHLDGVAHHDALSNLAYGTKKQNAFDRRGHGTHFCGEKHPSSQLTEADVAAIRSLNGKITHAVLGQMFGVSQQHITNLVKRKRWAHV